MITFVTETDSVYEYDFRAQRIRRLPAEGAMRRDSEWLTLLSTPSIIVGQPVHMWLEPLGDGFATQRTTTPVVSIEEDSS